MPDKSLLRSVQTAAPEVQKEVCMPIIRYLQKGKFEALRSPIMVQKGHAHEL
ncbi:hypothetical protein S1OALGB6SA_245 [Olavius algarvensis spirochete endosymbiont]|nr:MAG: hypothetical protein [Olavius algarvensis spirochete endosymbiont]VDA99182.1 hypothetical protein S1OALGB6SA_245 [Olavius algarvensis spirochete endosymbiont]